MISQTITIPSQPLENQPFTLHYNNPTYVPSYSTSNTNFVLKNTNGNTVSMYAIANSTGQLTALSPATIGTGGTISRFISIISI